MSATESIPVPSLRHVALLVRKFDECLDFYMRVVGYSCQWQPDGDNVYLSCGDDNLALHRAASAGKAVEAGALDHIGFFLPTRAQVDALYRWFVSNQVQTEAAPRPHRDGAYSFYCRDPDGNRLQFICHPPVAGKLSARWQRVPAVAQAQPGADISGAQDD